MNGLRLLTLEEKNALAFLADAADRCRKEDMRTPEVLASLDLLARSTSSPSVRPTASPGDREFHDMLYRGSPKPTP
jgi:hypothetical protein